jgi:hypothetical protein
MLDAVLHILLLIVVPSSDPKEFVALFHGFVPVIFPVKGLPSSYLLSIILAIFGDIEAKEGVDEILAIDLCIVCVESNGIFELILRFGIGLFVQALPTQEHKAGLLQ